MWWPLAYWILGNSIAAYMYALEWGGVVSGFLGSDARVSVGFGPAERAERCGACAERVRSVKEGGTVQSVCGAEQRGVSKGEKEGETVDADASGGPNVV